MKNPAKKISPALFVTILICFFLPFVSISCEKQELISFNGVELATGSRIKEASFTGEEKEHKIPGDPIAALALLSSIAGFGTSFIKAKKSAIAPAASGVAGVILLLMLKSKIDDEILKQGQGLIVASYGLGFWLAFILFLSATILNIYSLVQVEDKNTVE